MSHLHLGLALLLVLTPLTSVAAGAKTLVTVNGAKITAQQLAGRVLQQLSAVRKQSEFTPQMSKALEKRTLEGMIDEELLYQEAVRRSLVVSDGEVDRAVRRATAAAGGAKKMAVRLRSIHKSMQDYRREVKRELTLRRAVDRLVDRQAKASDKEVAALFNKNKAAYRQPEAVKLRQIFVPVAAKASNKDVARARARADKIVARLKAGADFAKVARQQAARVKPAQKAAKGKRANPHAAGKHSGKQPARWVNKGSLLPNLDKVAFSLKSGQIGGPVKMPVGFVIIKVEGKRPAKQPRLAELAPKIKLQLYRQRAPARLAKLMKELRTRAKIVHTK